MSYNYSVLYNYYLILNIPLALIAVLTGLIRLDGVYARGSRGSPHEAAIPLLAPPPER